MHINSLIVTFAIAAPAALTQAGLPNAHTWPMQHIMVSMDNNALEAHSSADASNPVEMLRFAGEQYDGPASVLDDKFYSDQYGWVLDGIVDPGFGNSIWIEMITQSDGLETYAGGRRMMIENQSFDPIFSTAGSESRWQWSGMMTHNWYAASTLGDYQATYNIYIGDSVGKAVAGYTATTFTAYLRAVPTPATGSILGLGFLAAARRKREQA